jgi:uncharacterized protein YnzC (UPF0291/DUF896 family)
MKSNQLSVTVIFIGVIHILHVTGLKKLTAISTQESKELGTSRGCYLAAIKHEIQGRLATISS